MDLIKDEFSGIGQALDGSLCTTSAEASYITMATPPPGQIVFANNGKPWLTFHPDGRVTADPDMKPDEAAQKVIDFVISTWPAAIGKTQ